MNRAQKIARWTLIWAAIALGLTAIAVAILYSIWGFPIAYSGMGFLCLFAVAGLGSMMFPQDKGVVTCDERDRLINQRASMIAFGASYLVMGLGCMVPFFVLGYKAQIHVYWLPDIFMAGGITVFVVHAAAILIHYGSDSRQEESK